MMVGTAPLTALRKRSTTPKRSSPSQHLATTFLTAATLILTNSTTLVVSALSIPSWPTIESTLTLPSLTSSTPSTIDSALDDASSTSTSTPNFSTTHPTLYRERHGWCPYSERVWLALEMKGIAYDTIRIDNMGGRRPSYFNGQTPQIRWGDGRTQGESMDLVRDLDLAYPDCGPVLYPDDDQSVRVLVEEVVSKFRSVFPRARPSSRAAFLFDYNGDPLFRSEFERVLSETNDLLSRTSGPFFCGEDVTAADVAWAPFLERYGGQLPALHEGLDPRDASVYPHLADWYRAMETKVPAYSCRVMGDKSSWRKVLQMAGFGNAGLPPSVLKNYSKEEKVESAPLSEEEKKRQNVLWAAYAETRAYVAETPGAEAAAVLTRNRKAICADVRSQKAPSSKCWVERGLPVDNDGVLDEAMRGLASALMKDTDGEAAEVVRSVEGSAALAGYLDERMCVPRDMGALPAGVIKRLAARGLE